MNSLTLWLYIASGVVIGLLAAFAAHNRRVGWKKTRTTLAEALDGLYADLGLSVEPGDSEPGRMTITRRTETAVDPADFSEQLTRLMKALGEAAARPNEVKAGEGDTRPRGRLLVQIQGR
jgi:hypothetical protein